MRPVLAASLVIACASVATAAYQLAPGRPVKAPKEPVPVVMAEPSPARVIPLAPSGSVVPRPEKPAVTPVVLASVPSAQEETASAAPDVRSSVARTLDGMKATEAQPTGTGLSVAQEEALRQMAARRRVRPVTRMPFALEPGAEVPAQVYLHPVPPEVAALASGNLGFAMVGNRIAVVATDTRKVVAVTGG